jgi:HK97 gp10 family phage protein
MGLPNYVKITKDGVEYQSGVDRANYTMHELLRAALRDCGKYVCRVGRQNMPKRTGRARRNMQYWVRSKQEYPDLRVGYKVGGFYGGFFETGTEKQPKIAPLYNAVADNINEIRLIQGQYLSAVEDENRVLGLIDEGETISNDN